MDNIANAIRFAGFLIFMGLIYHGSGVTQLVSDAPGLVMHKQDLGN